MPDIEKDDIRRAVRGRYAAIAKSDDCGCSSAASTCCGATADDTSQRLGYSAAETSAVPEGSNLGLGCGNPLAIASLRPGQTVLDLGSGAGFDCFLAAKGVGESGHVIGVDLTPDMISKARANAARGGYHNVEFRLGEIEHLPVADASVDVVISNCVINLSPEKQQVFLDAFRVLKRGGRLAIADVVATTTLPPHIRKDLALHAGCLAGASLIDDIQIFLRTAGFVNVRIQPKDQSREFIRDWAPGRKIEDFVVSATIEAVKP